MITQMLDPTVYTFTWYAIPTLFTAIATFLLGVVVLVRERGSAIGFSFSLVTFTIGIWLFSFSWMYATTDDRVALWWAKAAYLGVPLIPSAIYQFSVRVLGIYERCKVVVYASWLLSLTFAALIIGTDALFYDLYSYWWGFYPRYRWLSIPYLAFFFGMLIWILWEYWREYQKAEPAVRKLRIRSLIIAFGVVYVAAIDYLPKYGVAIYPFGYIPVLLLVILMARTIRRYRLVDITPSFAAQQIINTMVEPLIVCDVEGKIQLINPALRSTFGYSEQELHGAPIESLVGASPNSVDASTAEVEKLRDTLRRAVVRDEEIVFRTRDGEPVDVSLSLSHLQDRDRVRVGTVVVARDIRERKRAEEALRESQERLQMVVSGTPVVLFALDREGTFLLSEGKGLQVLGLSPGEVVGLSAFEIYRDAPQITENLCRALAGEEFISVVEIGAVTFETWYAPLRDQGGQVTGVIGVGTDVTEREHAIEALRESEERYALAVQGANDGLWDWNVETNELYLSPRWKAMLGYTDAEIPNHIQAWYKLIHPGDVALVEAEIEAHLRGFTSYFESEHRKLHKDGSVRWMLSRGLAVRDETGRAYRMAGSQTDITERKRAEEQLLHDALHDALTGLPNRALLTDRLEQALKRSRSHEDYRFALLFLDCDRFKLVNDGLGHMVGDQLLIAIAERLAGCLGPGDTLARLGGDEFVVLLDDIRDVTDATRAAERLQRTLMEPFELSGREIFTSVSIGIVLSAPGYQQVDEVLRDADIAMYRAKAYGKARYEVFDQSMQSRALKMLQLETELHRAVERDEFVLYYQPIVSLSTGGIVGCEALIRWQHPQRGLILPEEFIPIAEETGLIIPIGQWVLRAACQQMRLWHEQFHHNGVPTVSVNLSGKQLKHFDLVNQVEAVLHNNQLGPSKLRLEVTESVIMDEDGAIATVLHRLRDLRIGLQIDDFGTGYSSLNHLHQFPVETLKIDRSFIRRIESDNESNKVVQTIVSLAHHLDLRVVAEGIETSQQLQYLQEIRCDYGQGYIFSEPLRAEALADLVTSTPRW